jgi:hypothetical protein
MLVKFLQWQEESVDDTTIKQELKHEETIQEKMIGFKR